SSAIIYLLRLTLLFIFIKFTQPLRFTLFPYTTLFRSNVIDTIVHVRNAKTDDEFQKRVEQQKYVLNKLRSFLSRNSVNWGISVADRKSTRLNSSHLSTSYADFCLKKKNKHTTYSIRKC